MSTTVEYDILVEVLDAVKDLKKLQTETKKTKDGLDDTKKSGLTMAGDIGSAFTGLKNAASTVANAITKITSAFVDAAKASFELTREVVDSINDLNDLSTVSGISAQNIEALRTAFVASGQSADSANTILKMFPRIMNQLSNETSDASKVFRGLGLSMRDASGNAKSADQVFIEMIHAVQGIDDQTQKARTAMALFGRQASGVVQALGADKFEAFTDAVERYGTKAGPEASASAAQFQVNLALLDLASKRLKQTLVENTGTFDFFANTLKKVVASITALNVFLQKGEEGLKKLAQAGLFLVHIVLNQLLEAFKKFLLQGLKPFFDLLNMLSEQITGQSLFGNLAETIAAVTVRAFDLNDAVDASSAAYAKEMQILDQNTSTKDDASKTAQQLAADYKMIEAVLAKLNKATKENTKATDDNSKRAARRAKLLADLVKRREKAETEVSQIQKSAASDLLSALDQINQREEERLQRLREITKEQKISTAEAQRAVAARAERERAALRQQDAARGVGVVGSAISAVSSPQALLDTAGALAGPVGSAVSSALGGLAALGDTSQVDEEVLASVMEETGKNRDAALRQILIEDKAREFEVFFQAIAMGLQMLPSLLIKTLPPILLKAAFAIQMELKRLPFTIIGALIELGATIIKGIRDFFSADNIGKAIGDAIKSVLDFFLEPITDALNFAGDLFSGDSKMGGGRFLSAQGGLRFTGRNQGLALLHQGEMVVPRSGQMSSSVARDVEAQTGGGGVTININSAVTERSAIDSLVRKIEDRFGSFGQSTSPLFGGQ